MVNRFLKKAMLIFIFSHIAGCASFYNQETPEVGELPDVSGFQNKPKVYVDLKVFFGDPAKSSATEIPQALDIFKPAVEAVINEKAIFSEYTFDQFKQNEMDYKLSLHFYNYGNSGAAAVSGFITGFTLGVIPGAATDNYILKADLIKDEKSVGTVENKDSITTWVGLVFIPLMGKTPKSAIQKSITNQVKAALLEMIKNKQLKYSSIGYLLYHPLVM